MACDPNDLAEAAKCFQCLSPVETLQIQTYLLAMIAGGSTDPEVLKEEAKCFQCLSEQESLRIQDYLLCSIANA